MTGKNYGAELLDEAHLRHRENQESDKTNEMFERLNAVKWIFDNRIEGDEGIGQKGPVP